MQSHLKSKMFWRRNHAFNMFYFYFFKTGQLHLEACTLDFTVPIKVVKAFEENMSKTKSDGNAVTRSIM